MSEASNSPSAASLDHVYLDHNATTPLDPRVGEAMLPWLLGSLDPSLGHGERAGGGRWGRWGNPSSAHAFGRDASAAVEAAREQVAALLEAKPEEVIFTASGTEANNAVINTVAREAGGCGHVVLSAFEHPSVDAAVARWEELGMSATRVAPGPDGVVSAAAMAEAMREETVLLCLMLAQNEIGTLQPVAEVAAAARRRGVPLLCDAVQAPGKVPLGVEALGVDYLTLGAHKLYGPLGAAALWVRPGLTAESLAAGAGQEGGRRAGTENVAAIVGFGAAARWAQQELEFRHEHSRELRDAFEAAVAAEPSLQPHEIWGRGAPRLPNTSSIAFPGVVAAQLARRLDGAGFAVSTGAACHDGGAPSGALGALGASSAMASATLRVSFGAVNEHEQVEAFVAALAHEVSALRHGVLV
ncbi:MAG: cysteine desulfurase family protein [Acidobacteriota bacterium]